jgi:hypothetical protein
MTVEKHGTLVLSGMDVEGLLASDACITAVGEAHLRRPVCPAQLGEHKTHPMINTDRR